MKLFNTLKSIDPLTYVAFTMTFAVAFMLGQHTAAKDAASELEVVYSDPYKASTLDECVSTDPTFSPDSVPVIEPIDCEPGDKECEKANKLNAGKPAHYPSICEPYIFPNEHKERNL